MAVKQRIAQLLEQLNRGVYEKEEVIALSLLSAVAGESIFMLGAPGVAKSLIARRLKYAFKDGKSFEYLMSRFSTPDEIFGPVAISKLKNEDKYERITESYLPEADIVFLDEIWKASPSIQNALLTVLNEKVYRNGAQEIKVPMKALISASNELPAKNEGLEALWDRFLVRLLVEGIREKENFNAMISENLDSYTDNIDENLKITDEEYKQWSKAIDKIDIPDNVFNVIDVIRKKLQVHNDDEKNVENPIYISDRRWRKIIRLLRTSAFLNDRQAVDLMDCFLIKECLWNEEKQRKIVANFVSDTIQKHGYKLPFDFKSLKEELEDLKKDIWNNTHIEQDTRIEIPKILSIDKYKKNEKEILIANTYWENEKHNKIDKNDYIESSAPFYQIAGFLCWNPNIFRTYNNYILKSDFDSLGVLNAKISIYTYKEVRDFFNDSIYINGERFTGIELFDSDHEYNSWESKKEKLPEHFARKGSHKYSLFIDNIEYYLITTIKGDKSQQIKKTDETVENEWDKNIKHFSEIITQCQFEIDSNSSSSMNNLFVSSIPNIEDNIEKIKQPIETLDLEIKSIQNDYKHLNEKNKIIKDTFELEEIKDLFQNASINYDGVIDRIISFVNGSNAGNSTNNEHYTFNSKEKHNHFNIDSDFILNGNFEMFLHQNEKYNLDTLKREIKNKLAKEKLF